ncbi:hypothetical protein Fmac_005674 [Flemingia macrophylla]|uniref:Uncharacterized protein n=1 Tax=Flemingia macrophylla TaxID=520843 RepID=A0ABD1N8H8_9FABA
MIKSEVANLKKPKAIEYQHFEYFALIITQNVFIEDETEANLLHLNTFLTMDSSKNLQWT